MYFYSANNEPHFNAVKSAFAEDILVVVSYYNASAQDGSE